MDHTVNRLRVGARGGRRYSIAHIQPHGFSRDEAINVCAWLIATADIGHNEIIDAVAQASGKEWTDSPAEGTPEGPRAYYVVPFGAQQNRDVFFLTTQRVNRFADAKSALHAVSEENAKGHGYLSFIVVDDLGRVQEPSEVNGK